MPHIYLVAISYNRQDMDHARFCCHSKWACRSHPNWDWMTIPDFGAAQKPRDADRHDEPS